MLMAPIPIIITSHQEVTISHISNVCYQILLYLEESRSILTDNLSTVTAIIKVIFSTVFNLIILLTSLYIYRPDGQDFHKSASQYYTVNIGGNKFKCCLPSSCSDPTTNIITVHIFNELYLIVLTHTLICY